MKITNYSEFIKGLNPNKILEDSTLSGYDQAPIDFDHDTSTEISKDKVESLIKKLEKSEDDANKARYDYLNCSDLDLAKKQELKNVLNSLERISYIMREEFRAIIGLEDYRYG